MYETIVYPTDGSPPAAVAFEHACTMASAFGATLHVVYVLRPNEPPPSIEDPAAEADPDTAGREAVEGAAREAADRGIETVEAILRGPTAEAILEYAETKDADLIVMGTHGRTGLDRALIGSVTDDVVHGATVPVVVCDDGEHG